MQQASPLLPLRARTGSKCSRILTEFHLKPLSMSPLNKGLCLQCMILRAIFVTCWSLIVAWVTVRCRSRSLLSEPNSIPPNQLWTLLAIAALPADILRRRQPACERVAAKASAVEEHPPAYLCWLEGQATSRSRPILDNRASMYRRRVFLRSYWPVPRTGDGSGVRLLLA